MISDEFDLEEIESRLYSQVYHSTAADMQDGEPAIMNVNVDITLENSNNASKNKYRYFQNDRPANSSPADSGKRTPCNTVPIQNNITINPNPSGMMPTKTTFCSAPENLMGTEENYLGIQNNIIVNQYPMPVIFNPELNDVLNPTVNSQLFPWPSENISRILRNTKRQQWAENKLRNRIRSKKKRPKDKKTVRANVSQKQSDVVYILGESDSDDCVIVQDEQSIKSVTINTGFPKRYDENSSDRKPESDDDIIYIPPPPVEVINVDMDDIGARPNECNTELQKELISEFVADTSTSQNVQEVINVVESSASNDFLESCNIGNSTEDFNFSLHGTDFNNDNVDFVKPTKPVEFCETESSCSTNTNECNRDFNNSVKTIVFSEVEFPKEDMFSDKNLESFGKFITPERGSRKALQLVETESEGSSPESDYEPSEVTNKNLSTPKRFEKNLPNLSPMNEILVTETGHSKSKYDTPKKVPKKRSSVVLVNRETDGCVEEGNNKKTKKKKLLKKQLRNEIIQQVRKEINIDRRQKKKKKRLESDDTLDANTSDKSNKKRKKVKTSESDVTSEESSEPMKKKKGRVSESTQTTENGDCVSEKPKKKKSTNNSENEAKEVVDITKKKKSKFVESDKNSENELVPEESRKKKKPTKNSESETNEENVEVTRKKKNKLESGKNSEKQLVTEESKKKRSENNSESETNAENFEVTRKKKNKFVEPGKNSENEIILVESKKKRFVDNSESEPNAENVDITRKKKNKLIESGKNSESELVSEESQRRKSVNNLESETNAENVEMTRKKKNKFVKSGRNSENELVPEEPQKRRMINNSESETNAENVEVIRKKNKLIESGKNSESELVPEELQRRKSVNNLESETNAENVEMTRKKKNKFVKSGRNSENELVPEEPQKRRMINNSDSETNAENVEVTRKKNKLIESGKNSESELVPEVSQRRKSINNLESETNPENVEMTREKNELVESGKHSENELVPEESPRKSADDNSASATIEETVEVIQKKNTKSIELVENLEMESCPEKLKKKKENLESSDYGKQKRSSVKPDQELENTESGNTIEIVNIVNIVADIIDVEENSITEIIQSEQELTSLEKEGKTAHISEVNRDETALSIEEKTSDIVVDVLDPTQTSNIDNSKDDTEDEFIVVDDIGPVVSDTVPAEKVQSIVDSSDEYIEVVLTSGGEDSLGSIEENLQLANCSANDEATSKSEELVIVDDSSGSNILSPPDVDKVDKDLKEFDVDVIQGKQSDNPDSWRISHKDRIVELNIYGSKGPRCNRCRHYGHTGIRCPEKLEPPNCSLCGFPGHQHPRCPRKICTQCGNEGDYSMTYCWKCFKFRNSICRLCNMRGHISKTCPDLWRRYHLTTQPGPLVVSQGPQLKPRYEQWCSGCARQGHLEHECDYYNREYPPSNPSIISYEDIYLHTKRIPQETVAISSTTPQMVEKQPQPSNSFFVLPTQNVSHSIPPLMSLDLPDMSKNVVEATVTNSDIETPQNSQSSQVVLNPFANDNAKPLFAKQSILNQMKQNFTKEDYNRQQTNLNPNQETKLSKKSRQKISRIIMTMPGPIIREYLKKEMSELEGLVGQSNPRYLRKQLFKYENICRKNVTDIGQYFRIRIINMFLFGIHMCLDGKKHMNILKRFVSDKTFNKLDNYKRKSLLSSYNYIFGMKKHESDNYAKCIHMLIQKYDEGKLYCESS